MKNDLLAQAYCATLLREAEEISADQRVQFVRSELFGNLSALRGSMARVAALPTPNTLRGLVFDIALARSTAARTSAAFSAQPIDRRLREIVQGLDSAPMATTDEGDAVQFALEWASRTHESLVSLARVLFPRGN